MQGIQPVNQASSTSSLLPGISSLIDQTNVQIRSFAATERPVFITGESGTEKSFAAKLIHRLSPRSHRPLLKVSISWKLPPDLARYFERGAGGTLLIHLQRDFPIDMQYTLVEMAAHGCFADPMSGEVIASDVRIVLMTRFELEQLEEKTPLLPELKELLQAQHIEIPPLRRRMEDIPALVRYAIKRAHDTGRTPATAADPQVLALFRQWHWPGNAEDLLLVTAQAAISARGDYVTLDDLPEEFLKQMSPDAIDKALSVRLPRPFVQPRATVPSRRYEQQPQAGIARPTPSPLDWEEPPTPAPRPYQRLNLQEAETQESDIKSRKEIAVEGELAEEGLEQAPQRPGIPQRLLGLARRLNSQTDILSHQMTGPVDSPYHPINLARLLNEKSDEEAVMALELELDHGLDLVMALRRQLALLNLRQRQSAETIRDLVNRIRMQGDSESVPRNEEVIEETKELTEYLKNIDEIVQRVSRELPSFGQHLRNTLEGGLEPETLHRSPGLFPQDPREDSGKSNEAEDTQDES